MKAAVLYKTDEYVDHNRTNIREQIEEILDDPNNFQLKEFNDDESMFHLIVNELGNPNVGVTASNIWENRDVVYAGYYIDYTELKDFSEDADPKGKRVDLNNFGSQVTSQHVTGNLVIVKKRLSYEVNDNNVKTNTLIDDLSRFDLLNMLEKVYVKEGVVISTDGDMRVYKYIVNPLEHLMLTDPDYAKNYVYHEYEIYTHVMIVIVDVREQNGTRNDTATLLCGKPVNGTVFVGMYRKPEYNEQPPYVGVSIQRLKDILKIRKKAASLTTGMQRSEKEYVNFDKILELEREKHSDKTSQIASEITGELLNAATLVPNPSIKFKSC